MSEILWFHGDEHLFKTTGRVPNIGEEIFLSGPIASFSERRRRFRVKNIATSLRKYRYESSSRLDVDGLIGEMAEVSERGGIYERWLCALPCCGN